MSEETGNNGESSHESNSDDAQMEVLAPVSGLYETWFLDYASYVILDRAVPYLNDGLKPVQRRILHAMKEMDDGRFNKVANIIGQTMQYHPHGDQAISGAIVNLGQKDLLIETQGNWGNIFTGDRAAAPRYIEARPSKFALAVAFNPQTTEWQLSYDGRKREPVTLPVKFPLVLAQGVEGIAVGLSTKIMPHNFIELCKACIAHLEGKPFKLYPDFPTGGMIDVSNYNDGERGGKIRVRAKIEEVDKKTVVIRDIPYGTTTLSVIESILKANEKGKLKVRKIEDNTARNVEIFVHLPKGVSPAIAIDAMYAFTQCEVSISPNCCLIIGDNPVFTNVRKCLKMSTDHTVNLLKLELEIKKAELEQRWHMSSLEKIFIENRIYRDIEEEETWEGVIEAIDRGLDPFKKLLFREVTEEDIVRLTEIKIKRISKFDSFKADEAIKRLEEQLEEVKHHLAHLVEYAIDWFKSLLDKFGKGRERMTEIKAFDSISAAQVAVANRKLYMDAKEGFIGTGLKKADYICDCSDIDDVIIFRKDGTMMVTKVSDKAFVGKGILHAAVWNKNDDRMVYHLIYEDPKDKRTYAKRFNVTSITRDREYLLSKSGQKCKVFYFSANPNGEAELLTVKMKPGNKLKKPVFDQEVTEFNIKGRGAGGYLLTKHPVHKVTLKSKGASTLPGRDIWFDDSIKRLNTDGIGQFLGSFKGEDRILLLFDDGSYELTDDELTNRYEGKGTITEILKLTEDTVISAIHYEPKNKKYYIKRFQIETTTLEKKYSYISEEAGSRLVFVTAKPGPKIKVKYFKKAASDQVIAIEEFMSVKGWRAIGNTLSANRISSVDLLEWREPEVEEVPEEEAEAGESKATAAKEGSTDKYPDIPMDVVDTRDKDNPKPKGKKGGDENQAKLF